MQHVTTLNYVISKHRNKNAFVLAKINHTKYLALFVGSSYTPLWLLRCIRIHPRVFMQPGSRDPWQNHRDSEGQTEREIGAFPPQALINSVLEQVRRSIVNKLLSGDRWTVKYLMFNVNN